MTEKLQTRNDRLGKRLKLAKVAILQQRCEILQLKKEITQTKREVLENVLYEASEYENTPMLKGPDYLRRLFTRQLKELE